MKLARRRRKAVCRRESGCFWNLTEGQQGAQKSKPVALPLVPASSNTAFRLYRISSHADLRQDLDWQDHHLGGRVLRHYRQR